MPEKYRVGQILLPAHDQDAGFRIVKATINDMHYEMSKRAWEDEPSSEQAFIHRDAGLSNFGYDARAFVRELTLPASTPSGVDAAQAQPGS